VFVFSLSKKEKHACRFSFDSTKSSVSVKEGGCWERGRKEGRKEGRGTFVQRRRYLGGTGEESKSNIEGRKQGGGKGKPDIIDGIRDRKKKK